MLNGSNNVCSASNASAEKKSLDEENKFFEIFLSHLKTWV